jgi:hypothetical protein
MKKTIVVSMLAAAAWGAVYAQSLPVVKAVGFGGTARMIARGGGGTVGGQEADGWVELSAPAPCVDMCGGTYVNGQRAGGMIVQISSSNPAVAKVQPVTGRIMVPVGQTRTTFTVLTSGVATSTRVTISAWREGSAPQTTVLNVVPPSLMNVTIDQSTVISGGSAHGTVTFNGVPGPGGIKATLTSNSAAVQVPASASLDENKTAATFEIKTSGVATITSVTITAAYGDRKPTAALTVTPAILTKYDNNGLQLNGAAPAGGAVINLSSADPTHESVPPTVTIPAGGSKVGVSVVKHEDYSAHNVTISATYKGVTEKYADYVSAKIKPDLAIKEVTLRDRFGNAVTHPQDAQPYKMCAAIEMLGVNKFGDYQYPLSTILHVSYLSPTGTGTSAGHEFDFPVTFPISVDQVNGGYMFYGAHQNSDGSIWWFDPTCIDMPGLPQSGSYTDVTLIVDPNNKNDESNTGNNTHKLRITRQ